MTDAWKKRAQDASFGHQSDLAYVPYTLHQLPPKATLHIRAYWDLTTKGDAVEAKSRIAGLLGAACGDDLYILDEWVGILDYPGTKTMIVAHQQHEVPGTGIKWGDAGKVFVEYKANGIPLVADFAADTRPEIVAFSKRLFPFPDPDDFDMKAFSRLPKEDRAKLQSDKTEQKRILLPAGATWTEDWLSEVVGFPNATFSDRVDCLSMLLYDLGGTKFSAHTYAQNVIKAAAREQ